MKGQILTIKGAASWASYLINGDSSSLTDSEVALANNWLCSNEVADVLDCADESHFSWCYGLHTGDTVSGGDLLEYTCLLREDSKCTCDAGGSAGCPVHDPIEDGTSGQDRECYSDNQDRENYS